MRGDAEHLVGIVRAVAATPQPKLLERSPSVRTAHINRRFSEQLLFFGGPAFANRPKMLETFKGFNKTARRGSLTPPKPPTVGLPAQFCWGLLSVEGRHFFNPSEVFRNERV